MEETAATVGLSAAPVRPRLTVNKQSLNAGKAVSDYCPPWQANNFPSEVVVDSRLIVLLEPLRRLLDRPSLDLVRRRLHQLKHIALKTIRSLTKRATAKAKSLQTNIIPNIAVAKVKNPHNRWLAGSLAADPRPLVGNTITFTIFSTLPIELRKMIWKTAAHIQRVLEVEEKSQDESIPYAWQISPASRQVPCVLHVSREARTEALIHYQQLNRWSTSIHDEDTDEDVQESREVAVPQVYYNRTVDILYFGPEVQLETLNHFIIQNPSILRVALELPGKLKYPHLNHSLPIGSHWEEVLPRGSSRLNQTLRILHGFYPQKDSTDPQNAQKMALFPGLGGLKEVIWVIDASPVYLARQAMSTIDDAVGLVPVDDNFLETVKIHNMHIPKYREEIDNIAAGDGIFGLGEKCSNMWPGEATPRFSLERLYLQSHSQNIFLRWFLRLGAKSEDQIWKVQQAATETMEQCNCVVRAYPRGFEGPGEYSVIFGGLRSEVLKAMVVLCWLLFRQGFRIGVDIPLIDLSEACIPRRSWH